MKIPVMGLLALGVVAAIPQARAADTNPPTPQYFNWDMYSAQSPQTVYGYEAASNAYRNTYARNVPPAFENNGPSGPLPNVRFNGAVPLFDDDLTPQAADLPGTGPTSASGMAASPVNSR